VRIGYLHSFPSIPATDGSRVHAYEMLSRMVAAGHEVHVLGHEQCPGTVRHRQGQCGIVEVVQAADVVLVRMDGSIEFIAASEALRYRKPLVIEMNAPIDERRAWWAGVPSRCGHLRSRLRLLHDRKRLAGLCRRAAAVYVVAAELAGYARRYLGCSRVHVIPDGGSVERFSHDPAAMRYRGGTDDVLSVLWLGSALPWQDNTFLGKLATLVAEKNQRIRFTACSFEPEAALAELPNTTYLTGLSYTDLPAVMDKCHVGIVYYPTPTCLNGLFYRSPIKLFDYMAAGLCVVASPLGQIGRVISSGENGMLLADNTPEGCTKVLDDLWAHPRALADMGLNARTDVSTYYNWDRVVNRLCDLLHRAAQGEDLTTTVEMDRRSEPCRPAREGQPEQQARP